MSRWLGFIRNEIKKYENLLIRITKFKKFRALHENQFFVVLACHYLVLDGFDQLLSSFFMHCPHTKQCTAVNKIYDIKNFKFLLRNLKKSQDSNLCRLGEKLECYLCAMPTP